MAIVKPFQLAPGIYNISGSLYGTASIALTSSYNLSSSYALTASYAPNSSTSSYAASASYAISASYAMNATTASYAMNAATSSRSLTASYVNPLNQDVDITGNITIHGTASVDVLITTYNSSSIIYSSGSTKFGDSLDDTHEFTGSILVSGSTTLTGTLTVVDGITGSLFGSSSYALSASYAPSSDSASYADSSSYALTASFVESSSYALTASFVESSSYALTASFVESSSYALSSSYSFNSETASYALTASFVETASYSFNAETASYALTASFVESSSYALTASYIETASYALTASYVETSSYALTASYVETSSYALTASYVESSSYALTASFVESSSYSLTSSYSFNAETASYADTASYALTASHALSAVSASYATTASYAFTSSVATSSSYATTASYVNPLTQNVIITGSLSQGDGAETIGLYSHAEGNSTIASGSYSHAEGNATIARGQYSHAEGQNTLASGAYSHAEGQNTLSTGQSSHAEGNNTLSSGNSSHAEGYNTIASGSYQHAQGQYNIPSSEQGAFILGNGTNNASRSNLIFAANNTVQVTGSLEVSGSITGSLFGTASYATTASYAESASYTTTASYAESASYADSSSYASTASYAPSSTSASYAETASYLNTLNQDLTFNGNLILNGTASITYLDVTYESASVIYSSGSNQLGDNTDDVQTLIGTTKMSGSLVLTGSLNILGNQTTIGNRTLTGSWYVTGSSYLTGETTLSGSITISGNTTITGSITATNQTASFGYVSASFLDITGKQVVRGYTHYMPTTDIVPIASVGGYIFSSGSQGDLYFAQTNGVKNNVIRLRWLENNMYSGLLNGGLIGTASSTVYTVSSGSGLIVNLNGSLNTETYPTVDYVSWGNLSASIAPLSASYDQTFVAISSSNGTSSIFAQGIPYYDGQYDTLIPIGTVTHRDHSTIDGYKTQPNLAYGLSQRTSVFTKAFGALKLSGFNLLPSGSSTGSLVLSSGTAYLDGANYTTDVNNPSFESDAGTTVSKIFRYYQSGSEWNYDTNGGAGYATIDPNRYQLNGVLTTIPGTNANWTIQRCYWFPNTTQKAIIVYYGNAYYTSEAEARGEIPFETFQEAPDTAANAIYLGAIVVQEGAVFTDASTFTIYPGGLFRQIGGSGGGSSGAVGGVTQILAGTNVILSPTNGVGAVTVNALNTGGMTATGSYGSFYSTADQLNVGTVNSMSYTNTDISNGVYISGSDATKIKINNAGVYDIQFSAQFDRVSGGTANNVEIWLAKNGTDIPDTNTDLYIPGGAGTQAVAAWNWFVNPSPEDYYEIKWGSADANTRINAVPTTLYGPSIPSVIVTVNRIDAFLSNTGSFSGSFTGNLFGTASYATTALTASNSLTASYVNTLTQNVIITGSTATDLVRITQTGAGNALIVEDSTNPDSTPFVVTNTGLVGIGTTTPTATLDVNGNVQSGLATTASGTFTHTEGRETKASGSYSHAEGRETLTLGLYSHTEGYQTTASGLYSHAEGNGTQAIGLVSHAEGYYTTASGTYSHAEGYLSSTTGSYSHAEGNTTIASGIYSHTEGRETITVGMSSHAEGIYTTASGNYSHAEGYQTTALGFTSHAEGFNTVASGSYQHVQGQWNRSSSAQSAFIVGNGNSESTRSNLIFASGSTVQVTGSLDISGSITGSLFGTASYATTALTASNSLTASYVNTLTQNVIITGSTSTDLVRITQTGTGNAFVIEDTTNPDITPFVVANTGLVGIGTTTPTSTLDVNGNVQSGFATTASGNYSHAEGISTQSSGSYSHAEGRDTLTLGTYSHAEGRYTLTLGTYSHAEGYNTTSSGNYSHAEGYQTTALGFASHAEGYLTVSSGSHQHVQGQFNVSSSKEGAFILGNGTSESTRSNLIFASDSTVQITGSLNVSGSITGSLFGTASYATTALTASNALTSSYVNTLTQNVIITGSLDVSGSITATSYAGNGINNGKLLAMTELTASTLATFTVPSSTVFAAINCNSDATNRYAKVTFTAPSSGIVEIIFEADIVFVNSAAVQMIGLSTGSASTTTPSNGWFRINGDADASSATYRAVFNINALTPGTVYSYYVMAVCNFSGNLVRCGSLQTGAYVSGADRPSPLRVYARDMGTTVITTNPSS